MDCAVFHKIKESEKTILDPSLYPDLHQLMKGCIMGQDSSSIQVSWKYVFRFFCVILLTNKPTNRNIIGRGNIVVSKWLYRQQWQNNPNKFHCAHKYN